MNPFDNLASEIRSAVVGAADQTVPTLRVLRRGFSRQIKQLDGKQVIDLALRLLASARIPKWLAYELIHHHRAASAALNNNARGGSGDAKRTLGVCTLVVDDCDDMVVKALSWALRELGKRDAGAVRGFLSANDGRLAPRVVREVGNKLTTGLKNPRR